MSRKITKSLVCYETYLFSINIDMRQLSTENCWEIPIHLYIGKQSTSKYGARQLF
jgi:hypothetical protein